MKGDSGRDRVKRIGALGGGVSTIRAGTEQPGPEGPGCEGSGEDAAQSERSQSSAAALMRSAPGPERACSGGETWRLTISEVPSTASWRKRKANFSWRVAR